MSLALANFAKEVGAGPDKHILLLPDQAGWHTGKEVVANQSFGSPAELNAAVGARCVTLSDLPKLIRSHTLYRG